LTKVKVEKQDGPSKPYNSHNSKEMGGFKCSEAGLVKKSKRRCITGFEWEIKAMVQVQSWLAHTCT